MNRNDTAHPMLETLEPRQLLSTFTVMNSNDAGSGSLRQAVFDANNAAGADIIEFDGSLSGSTVSLYSGELAITDDLTINGLGADVLTIDAGNNSRIFANSASTSISGLRLINGYVYGSTPNGGAIHNTGDLTLTDSTLQWSSADSGGGIYNLDGTLTVTNSTVLGNYAYADGGGIYNSGGTLTLTDSTVQQNYAEYGGGGIFNSTGTVTLTNSTVSNNYAESGGGIINANFDGGQTEFGGTVTLTGSTVSNNTAYYGGGIWSSGTVELTDSTVSDNRAYRSSGGIYNAFGTLTMSGATISGNTATNNGGGVFNSGDLTVTDSTVSDNSANRGGGLYNAVGTVTLANTLLSNNSAGTEGGGIYSRTGGSVTLSNAVVSDSTAGDKGGGIFNDGSTLTLTDSTVSGNTASSDGGGFANSDGTLTLTDSTVSGNTAYQGGGIFISGPSALALTNSTVSANTAHSGGGIYGNSGVLTLTGSTVSGNSADSGEGGGIWSSGTLTLANTMVSENTARFGAGIFQSGEANLTDSTVSGNTATTHGGGILSYGGVLTVIDSTVATNTADFGGGISSEGGLYNDGVVTLTESRVSGNTATTHGGGIYSNSGSITLTNSTVSSNTAGRGGGLYSWNDVYGGVQTLLNSTISGNTADYGGGIYNDGGFFNSGTMTLKNSTVSGNTADIGGGIYDDEATLDVMNSTVALNLGGGGLYLEASTPTLKSTIVAGNTGGDVLNGTLHPSSSHNLIQNAASAGGLTNGVNHNIVGVDPLLGALADNGGSTQTHALLAFSPAINAGINPSALSTDQRGSIFARAFGGSPDIGAFERQSLSLLVSTTADAVDGDYSFGEFSLREALGLTNASPGLDDIGFDVSLTGTTIVLGGTQLAITDDVTITGLGAGDLSIDGNGHSAVFHNDGAASSISGMTITGGGTSAIYNNDGTLEISDAIITGNNTTSDGGGIYNLDGTLTLSNSTVSGNTAGTAGGGGGIFNFRGAVNITGSMIVDNATGESGSGGGILSSGGTVTITDSTVSGNTSVVDGGGIYNINGTLTLTDSTVSGNTAGSAGGGVFNSGAVTITRSTISGNTAVTSGGGVWTEGTLTLTNSTISGNSAGGFGGGIGMDDGAVVISNSTIANNVADADGNSSGQGGGIDVGKRTGAGTLTTTSTIYAGNARGSASPTPDDISLTGGTVSGTNNLIQSAASAGGLTNGVNGNLVGVDPKLGALADNGGSTQTHALLEGSPAFGAGLNPLNLTTDQRGGARTRGDAPDIGAFEGNARPTLDSLAVSAAQFAQGDLLTLAAGGASDPDGSVAEVRFYIDRNGDGIAQDAELLGTDADGSDGFSLLLTRAQTAVLGRGTASFLAVVFDDEGFRSSTGAASAEVLFSVRARQGAPAVGASTGDDTLWVGVVNEAGDVILFESTTGNVTNLSVAVGAPAATDDVIVFADPKDGLIYAVYPSAEGLIFVQRADDGSWSLRNLSVEAGIETDAGPVASLTQFSSTMASGRVVVIAGIDASGRIVAFQQSGTSTDGAWDWSFVDISADLDGQGMVTPAFTELISYVTPWNAWNIAGIDGNGNIQGVWVAPGSFTMWRIDNLSNITGAPPISGQLTVTQTSWSAINLGGVDTSGHLVVTWWVPSFRGNWVTSNLTTASGGETLTAGKATGFVTPWGAINYAGTNAAGDVTVYWWTPQTGGWVVTPLTANLAGDRPTGLLTSHVSSAGTMSVLGTTDEGEVTRLWWTPNDDGKWKLTDLTGEAVRA